jgi:hypothetical protein
VLAERHEERSQLADLGLAALLVHAEEVVIDRDDVAHAELGPVELDRRMEQVRREEVLWIGHPPPHLLRRRVDPQQPLARPHLVPPRPSTDDGVPGQPVSYCARLEEFASGRTDDPGSSAARLARRARSVGSEGRARVGPLHE